MYDVIIIGSGPAGLTAAIYASRAKLNVLVIEGNQPGGQLTTTTEVENFPGFKEGIMGPDLMQIMKEQAQRFGSEFKSGNASQVDFSDKVKKIWIGEDEYQTKSVIIATGASARWLKLENEAQYVGKGLSTCATCDGYFYRDKEIAVIGGGDSAMEEANFLTKFAKKVTLIHRRDEFRASKIMIDRAKANEKIEFLTNYHVVKYIGESKLEKVLLEHTETKEQKEFALDGLFLAIGHIPNTKFLAGHVDLDENGYVLTKEGRMTSAHGVFSAGDVDDIIYRQAITAAGSGCKAAMDVEKWLENNE